MGFKRWNQFIELAVGCEDKWGTPIVGEWKLHTKESLSHYVNAFREEHSGKSLIADL